MAAKVTIRRAGLVDALLLWWGLRDIERQEVRAQTGRAPLAVLLGAVCSTHVRALRFDGRLVCLFGATEIARSQELGRVGHVWMLSTKAIERYPLALMHIAPRLLRAMFESFDVLTNHVYAEHAKAVRFVKRLGFYVLEAKPHGPSGEMFHQFFLAKEDLCALP